MTKKEKVINYLKKEIKKLNCGDKIPSETELMKKLCVSRYTVRSGINELTKEGLIRTEHRKGSFVQYKEKDKKYVIILIGENYISGSVRNTFKYLQKKFIEYIEEKKFVPVSFSDSDEGKINQFLNNNRNETMGVLSILANEKMLKNIIISNIPVISVIGAMPRQYPSVIIDFHGLYRKITKIIQKYYYKDIIIFSISYIINRKERDNLLGYALMKHFEKYNLYKISFSENMASAVSEFKAAMKSINKIPDAVIFLDDTIFNNCRLFFEEFQDILDRTKIITQSSGFTEYKENVCRIEYSMDEAVRKAFDLLLKINNGEFIKEYNIFIEPEIINEEYLKK